MPSPFPGMNPYLEQEAVWHDFHQRFIPRAADALTSQVRPGYIVTVDSHVYLHELPAEARRLVGSPDVSVAVTGSPGNVRPAGSISGGAVLGIVPLPVDAEKDSYIQIRDREGRELVTVVELLSPSNKAPGPDREQYLAKRREVLASGVHLVEIDLLRGWPRLPAEGLPQCDYCIMVSRAKERPRVQFWPATLRDTLPIIPVPLRDADGDATLDVQQILQQVYDGAGYEDYIYRGRPWPRLRPDDEAWARQFLPS